MNGHPDDERLNDWIDGLLEPADAEAVEAHVSACEACRAGADRLHALLEMAAALPESIDPPAGTWEAIAARTVELGRTRREVLRSLRLPLAAAAVVLVAVSAGATALLLRDAGRAGTGSTVAVAPVAAPAGGPVLVAAEDTFEREYGRLLAEFRARQDALDSATVAVVEENLRIIDAALERARSALQADPGNRALPLLITETHRQRIAVVERALRAATPPQRSEA